MIDELTRLHLAVLEPEALRSAALGVAVCGGSACGFDDREDSTPGGTAQLPAGRSRAYTDKAKSSSGSDPLTITVVGLLALVAVGGTVFCLIYAIWWLITFWAPLYLA